MAQVKVPHLECTPAPECVCQPNLSWTTLSARWDQGLGQMKQCMRHDEHNSWTHEQHCGYNILVQQFHCGHAKIFAILQCQLSSFSFFVGDHWCLSLCYLHVIPRFWTHVLHPASFLTNKGWNFMLRRDHWCLSLCYLCVFSCYLIP